MGPREVLNKMKWHSELGLRDTKITITHRGAPKDIKIINGEEILELGRGFMCITSPEGEVEIPYHRIIQIEAREKVLWQSEVEKWSSCWRC